MTLEKDKVCLDDEKTLLVQDMCLDTNMKTLLIKLIKKSLVYGHKMLHICLLKITMIHLHADWFLCDKNLDAL